MFDLKTINAVLSQLEEEKGLKKERILEAIEMSLASAYKKEFGKRGQIVKAIFDIDTGATEYSQIKTVVNKDDVVILEEGEVMPEVELKEGEEAPIKYNEEQHIFLETAKMIKTGVEAGEEIVFPLETKTDFGRIAAQAAKQTIRQQMRSAEKDYLSEQFGDKIGEIVSGTVQRVERGNIYVEMEKAEGVIPFREQIKHEKYRTGDRIRAYLFDVEDGRGGIMLKLSRTHPKFIEKLFEIEVPEIGNGIVEIKNVVREPGSRSKIAVLSHDEDIDPTGALIGQSGSRVTTVKSELSGENIDIIEWSEDIQQYIEDSLAPAKVVDSRIDQEAHEATVDVSDDQFSLAIGRGGQNVRLAAKLTGFKIDINNVEGSEDDESEKPEVADEKEEIVEEVSESTETDTLNESTENSEAESAEEEKVVEVEEVTPEETSDEVESSEEEKKEDTDVTEVSDEKEKK